MRSSTHADGTRVSYVGIVETRGSPQGDYDDAVYVEDPKGMMHERLGFQRDFLESVRIQKDAQRKGSSGNNPGEFHETGAYRRFESGVEQEAEDGTRIRYRDIGAELEEVNAESFQSHFDSTNMVPNS